MELLWRVCGNAQRILAGVAVLLLFAGTASFGADDSRLFTTGFEAFSGGDSKKAARTLSHLLDAHPETRLRELTLFYLARAHHRAGNQEEAAKAMARLLQEYPGTPLAAKAEKDLLGLVARYRKGEKLSRGGDDLDILPVAELAAVSAAPERGTTSVAEEKAAREKAEQERRAGEQAERARVARQKAEEERLVREKADRERLAREEAERTRLVMEKEKTARAKAPSHPAPNASSSVAAASGAGAEISGPLLRAVVKPEKSELFPGERVEYLVTLLNVGSGRAEGVSLRLMFPDGEYEPVDFARSGFRNEGGGALVLDNVAIDSGQALDYPVVFRVRNDAGIGQELRCSVRLLNGAIGTWDSYRSRASFVRAPRRP